jgi:hypothetical protein
MRRLLGFVALAALAVPLSSAPARPAAQSAQSPFTFEEVMIPMRDGVKLQTVILRPRGKLPARCRSCSSAPPMACRTPRPRHSGIASALAARTAISSCSRTCAAASSPDGKFTISTAGAQGTERAVDEATDAIDSIDWLVKTCEAITARSACGAYPIPAITAAVALAKPNPALKAVSPQAAWIDYWMNDDLHRNGAARLSYATDWVFSLQNKTRAMISTMAAMTARHAMTGSSGSAAPGNLDRRLFQGPVPQLTAMIDHPDYDQFWKKQRWTEQLGKTTVPTLMSPATGIRRIRWGLADLRQAEAEGPQGPEQHDGRRPLGARHLAHDGDKVGRMCRSADSGTEFMRHIEAPFFAYWLHGKGEQPDFEMKSFQSDPGSGRTIPVAAARAPRRPGCISMPMAACRSRAGGGRRVPRLYLGSRQPGAVPRAADQPHLSFAGMALVGSRRPALRRSSPRCAELCQRAAGPDLTVTGNMLSRDADGIDHGHRQRFRGQADRRAAGRLSHHHPAVRSATIRRRSTAIRWPIAMEVRRGRYLNSFEKPAPLTPDKVTAWDVPLRDHDHVFKKGHRIMVQIQSSWFPMIDRNPQSFVPNIYKAKPEDYAKATQRVCAGSVVTLPVVR